MDKLTFPELLSKVDDSIHDRVKTMADDPDVDGLVLFENLQFDSSAFGDRSICVYGKGKTYQLLVDFNGIWLNDLPSQRQYPVAYWAKQST